MHSFIKKIKSLIMKDGISVVMQKIYWKLTSRIFHAEAVFLWDSKNFNANRVAPEVSNRMGGIADCQPFASIFPSYIDQCHKRLNEGDRMYVALVDNKVAYIMWVASVNKLKLSYVDQHNIALASESLYIYNCFTLPEYRGMGIYPYMLSYVASLNPEMQCYVACRYYEKVSIKGVKRAGFRLRWKFFLLKVGAIKIKWRRQYL